MLKSRSQTLARMLLAGIAMLALPALGAEAVAPGKLPQPVIDAVARRFPGCTITSAQVEDDAEAGRAYSLDIRNGKENLVASADASGALSELGRVEPANRQMDALIPPVVKKNLPRAQLASMIFPLENNTLQASATMKLTNSGYEVSLAINPSTGGLISAIEVGIDPATLSAAAIKTIAAARPKSIIQSATEIRNPDFVLQGYEIIITTAQKKTLHLNIAADGKAVQ